MSMPIVFLKGRLQKYDRRGHESPSGYGPLSTVQAL